MAWGKVDDKLHTSVKWRRATKGGRALWTTALSWCSDQENGGQVPADMLRILDGTPADARSLVSAGLWDATADGWEFHDWADYNPDSASAKAVREAKSDGGKQGNHYRWHVKRKVRVPDCEFCESDPDSDNRSESDRTTESGANPPDPTRPDKKKTTSSKAEDDRAFEEFWQVYPKKADRGRARPAWGRAVKKADPAKIIASAQQYAATVDRRDNGKYIKHPTTWLNAEAWENEPVTDNKKSSLWDDEEMAS